MAYKGKKGGKLFPMHHLVPPFICVELNLTETALVRRMQPDHFHRTSSPQELNLDSFE
jgi:hypothetical protein